MRKLFFLIALIVGFSMESFCQVSQDEINKLRTEWHEAKDDSTKAFLIFQLAFAYRFSNMDSSLWFTDLALKNTFNPLRRAGLLSLKGATLLEHGRIPESMKLQFEALKITNSRKDTNITAFVLNRIGNTYMELGDYRKANDYYFQSWALFESIKDSLIYNEISNIGNIYSLMQMPDSSLYYLKQVLEVMSKGAPQTFIVRPELMFRLGNAYKLKGDTDTALKYYERGIAYAFAENDLRNLTMNNLFKARLFNDINNRDSAMTYSYSALENGKKLSFRKGISESALLLSELFRNKGQYDSALNYLLLANAEKEELTGAKRLRELQLIMLDEQERVRQAELKTVAEKNRLRLYTLLVGLGVLLVIAFILYRNNRQKQKANTALEAALQNLKSTQAQLLQSEKMASLGELTAGIAHEIQNPLNFVNNFSEVNMELIGEMKTSMEKGDLEEAKLISNSITQNLEKILSHGKRADGIVKGMLQHSRTSNGLKEPTDINKLVDEYLRLAYHGLRAKDKGFNATLQTDYDESFGNISIIPQDIGRVILNLITNAFYAVSEMKKNSANGYEPTVTVKTEKVGKNVEITVEDNGAGIPEEIRDKIFQPFYTTKPTGQGTGLGLSLSYDVVKAHGGELSMKSKQGEGAAFTIHLPIS